MARLTKSKVAEKRLLSYYERELDSDKDRHVSMSNKINRSAHGLDLRPKQVMMTAISKMDSRMPKTPQNDVGVIRISAAEFAAAWDLDIKNAYTELKAGCRKLLKSYLTLYDTDLDGRSVDEANYPWIIKAVYKKGEGWAEVRLNPELLTNFAGINKDFTRYRLSNARKIRSKYSWRLFERLEQFKDSGIWRVSIEEFWHIMEASEIQRSNFAQLRQKVIEPAIKELSKKDHWEITYQAKKRGRRIDQIEFKFRKNPQDELPF